MEESFFCVYFCYFVQLKLWKIGKRTFFEDVFIGKRT